MKQYVQMAAVVLSLLAGSMAQAKEGSLVIIGGALRPDNGPVWERVVALAGGQGAKIAVFATASGSPEQSAAQIAQRLRHYGGAPFVVPIAPRLAGSDYREAADDAALAAQVAAAGGAYFGGGDQGRITQALRRADGSNSKVLDALWAMYRGGGVIAGTSAGAAMMSSTMFYQPRDVLSTLTLGVRDGVELADGLGFIGKDVFIDQHLLVRGRFARMLPAMLAKGYKLGLGIDENTALVVRERHQVEVLGATGALVLDLGAASTDAKAGRFNISNARISYLEHGDRLNLADGSFTAGGDKVAGQPGAALAAPAGAEPPVSSGPLLSSDILAHSAVVQLMEKLVDSEQRTAVGLAFGAASVGAPAAGVEFTFSRVAETRAYRSEVSELVSIRNVRLDARPIIMAAPLYRPATP